MSNGVLSRKAKKKLFRIIISLSFFVMLFVTDKIVDLSTIYEGFGRWFFPFCLYFFIYIIIGYDIITKAFKNIIHGQIFDENFLMIIATFGAFGLAIFQGVNQQKIEGFDEACAVLIFYQIGEFFQSYATSKSRKSIAKLMDIKPEFANLKTDDGVKVVSPNDVKIDDILVVNPGEKIPVDGMIVAGETSLDTKPLTGESVYKDVAVGDEVLSGTMNMVSQIEIRVTKIYTKSSVFKILNLIENVSSKKSKSENFIVKFARFYTPIVCIFALFVAVLPSLISGNWSVWIYRALSFLVVSCPCALVISIPLSFFVGIGIASKNGVLIKGSNYLESLNKVNIFLFDKTGTLTQGVFEVVEVFPREREKEIIELAAVAEFASNHPVANSIKKFYGKEIQSDYSLKNVAGKGIVATKAGVQIICGNEKLMKEFSIDFSPIQSYGTVVYVAKNSEYLGHIIVSDKVKNEAKEVIESLAASCVIMLTGDNEQTAKNISDQLNIKESYSSLLPQDKIEKIESIIESKKQNEKICFVGDGINDAPALMLADVGISMGGVGSDAAIEASDIVLMKDDLRGIIKAKNIAKKTMKTVFQNIFFSISVKLLILILTVFGITSMWLAIFGDVGVAICAIINSMIIGKK